MENAGVCYLDVTNDKISVGKSSCFISGLEKCKHFYWKTYVFAAWTSEMTIFVYENAAF